MAIHVGDRVEVTTADGEHVVMRAIGSPEQGRDFPILWVCTEDEYERAQGAGDEPDGLPWPLTALRELQSA
jgi:bifunctional DNA-binding transcriptional regulator/antitoxin component of YhaV-PrlF toxin-antitoxin module